MTEEFKKWYNEEYANCLCTWKANKEESDLERQIDFDGLSWEMQWGIYQLYFWDTKKWWLSIYPYTDKFGGKIEGLWDKGVATRNFITNVPFQAQEKIVNLAFEKLKVINT